MDKLDGIFSHQKALDDFICESRGLQDITMPEWIQKETLAMMSELAELIDEVNFKWWKNEKPVNEDLVKDELVDILHFFVSMCLKTGMSPDELFSRYMNKNKENHDRQHGISKKEGYALSDIKRKK